MTESDRAFERTCYEFREGTNFQEYCEYIERLLVISDWHYTPEEAKARVKQKRDFIVNEFKNRENPFDTALEVGFVGG